MKKRCDSTSSSRNDGHERAVPILNYVELKKKGKEEWADRLLAATLRDLAQFDPARALGEQECEFSDNSD